MASHTLESRSNRSRRVSNSPQSNEADVQRTRQLLGTEVAFIHASEFDQLSVDAVEDGLAQDELYLELEPATGQRDAMPPFIAALFSIPLLTAKGEAALFRKMNFLLYRANALRSQLDPDHASVAVLDQIEEMLAQAEATRNQIAESNLRLVVSIARRFSDGNVTFDELVSEGNMILLKAIDKFDYSRGNRFSTYVTHSVQRHFFRQFKNTSRRRKKEIMTSDEILRDVVESHDDDRTDEFREALKMDTLVDHMQEALDDREQIIIRERFGLGELETKGRTLQSLSDELVGVCKERVRQIHHQAIEKLRELAGKLGLERSIA